MTNFLSRVIWGSPISLFSLKKPRYSREPRGLTYCDKTTIIPYGKNVCRYQDEKIVNFRLTCNNLCLDF